MPGLGEAVAPTLPGSPAGPHLADRGQACCGSPTVRWAALKNPWLPLRPIGTSSDWPQPPCQRSHRQDLSP